MKTNPNKEFRLLTVRETAQKLRIAPVTLYQNRGEFSKITRYKLGRAVRFDAAEVDEFIARRPARDRADAIDAALENHIVNSPRGTPENAFERKLWGTGL